MKVSKKDVVIIGGGVGGLTAAYGALQCGLEVVLIEKESSLGGASLRYNCVPTKTLMHSAKVAHLVRNAAEFGIDAYLLPVDLGKINDRVDAVVAEIRLQEDFDWFVQLGGEIVYGSPEFLDCNTILVNGNKICGRKIIIATGAKTLVPRISGLQSVGYLTNENVFQKISLPDKIIVLGGGGVGIEFAQAFARLGSSVVVVESGEQILSSEDPELVWQLRRMLEQEGVKFYTGTRVHEVYWQNKRKILACSNKEEEEDRFTIDGHEIFVATGCTPNIEGLNLEIGGVHYDVEGIFVDRYFRTSRKSIYAIGDVIKYPYKFTHLAEHQANSVVNHLAFKLPFCGRKKVLPRVIFTDPELAQVGLTEQEVIKRKLSCIEVLRFDFKHNDRAVARNEVTGRVKLFTRKNKILGASLLGPNAGELISELALAISMGARIEDIAATLHPYPTLAQVNRRAVNKHLTDKGIGKIAKKIVSYINKVKG